MKTFCDLIISGESSRLNNFLVELNKKISGDWKRSELSEKLIINSTDDEAYCYDVKKTKKYPAAKLWLFRVGSDKLSVTNIVPEEVGELTYDEYNSILNDFYTSFVVAAAESTGVISKMSNPEITINNWLNNETVARLEKFSRAANKHTGSSHPLDEERWFDFIVSSYKSKSGLPIDILGRWLVEDGWNEEKASDLMIEYERAIALLLFYENKYQ